ncbi:protein of unknown function [Limnospira indica PCC 8005]|uniref:Uncharacterized protein n=1 Tax=Limnospira indica PCC 8005 TaxID=376219 RepID=A0A9P1KCS1_9CYAN|nr:protein of unknown function [Limnospira indica PCC 8005]
MVERSAVNRLVVGSNPTRGVFAKNTALNAIARHSLNRISCPITRLIGGAFGEGDIFR